MPMRDALSPVHARPFARYAVAVAVAAASFLLRYILVQGLGLEMPTFITFYPAVVFVAVLAGLGPGLLVTALIVLGTAYLILPPVGHFAIERISDAVALTLFAAMGVLISLMAEDYRRGQRAIAAYEVKEVERQGEEALRKSEVLYRSLFNSMDEGFCIIEMIFDPEGKPADYLFLEVNAAFEKQTGLHDAVGKRMRDLDRKSVV